jgi:hypothetical protein
MAIELHMRKSSDPPDAGRSVPVATASTFDVYWAPLANELGLHWVPLFRTGFPVSSADVPFVVDELLRLKDRVVSSGGVAAQTVLPRLEAVLTELASAAKTPDLELYIG